MTSKVLVKLPVVPFSQKGSSCDDVLQRSKKPPAASNSGNNAASSESATGEAESSDARPHEHSHEDKVAQLEQNVKFLQEQHQTMLVALHKEIDQLRQRNRELQFQLVFSSKGPKISPCGISSPEDATTVPSCSNKLKESPTNIMPLQIELLEKDVQELRVCLDEEKKLNASLSATIDKQQQELAHAAAPTERATAASSDKAIQVDTTMECQQVEMQARLVDAEALVKRLRQENVEQRKELGQLKQQVSSSSTSSSSSSSSSSRNGRSAATHRVPAPPSSYYNPSSAAPIAALAIDPQQPRLSDEQQHQQTFPKFPPLQTQSYWHRASRTNHGGYDSGPQLHNYQRNARHHNHHHQSHHQHQPAQQHPQQQQYQQHHHQQLNQESRHQHHHNRHQAPVQQQQQSKDGQAKPPGSSSSSSSSAASSSLLPQLRNGSVRVDTSGSSYPPFFRARSSHGHSYYKDNNCEQPQQQQQNRSGNNRKYRGPKPPRRENGHHPQDGGGTPRDYTGNQQQHHNRDNQRQPRKPRS